MPIIKIEEINPNRSVAIWKITESLEELLSVRTLSDYDRTLFDKFRHEDKRREWLTGRLILKALAEHMNIPFKGIVKNEDGKPFLIDSEAEISLSHSFPYVAAIIDHKEDVGIDLEQPKEKLRKIAKRFLNEPELEFTANELTKLCICWCAKETLYKIYSKRKLAFRENMRIDPFDLDQENLFVGSILVNGRIKSYNLRYIIASDHIVTFNV